MEHIWTSKRFHKVQLGQSGDVCGPSVLLALEKESETMWESKVLGFTYLRLQSLISSLQSIVVLHSLQLQDNLERRSECVD